MSYFIITMEKVPSQAVMDFSFLAHPSSLQIPLTYFRVCTVKISTSIDIIHKADFARIFKVLAFTAQYSAFVAVEIVSAFSALVAIISVF